MYVVKFVKENYQSPGTYGKLTYLPGTTVEVEDYDPAEKGQCARGIHVIPIASDADFTNVLYGERLILLEVAEEDILYREGNGKMRVKKARVLGDITDYPEYLNAYLASAEGAYHYAFHVLSFPDDQTRTAACQNAEYACRYAMDIDNSAGEETRSGVCREARWALYYARAVDKSPREDTRKAACQQAWVAYQYAECVDKAFHPDTWEAVRKSANWKFQYQKRFPEAHTLEATPA